MAGGALFGRRLIEQYRLGRDYPGQFVALRAAHILVRSPQREIRPRLMIEQRRLPLDAVMAVRARGNVRLRELLAVDIFMAILALDGRSREIHIDQLRFQVGRLVTVHAARRPMRP